MAGAGMYGCLSPEDSEIGGNLLGGADGVSILFDSPANFGLSSQLELVEGDSNVFSVGFGVGRGTFIGFSNSLSEIMIGGLTFGDGP